MTGLLILTELAQRRFVIFHNGEKILLLSAKHLSAEEWSIDKTIRRIVHRSTNVEVLSPIKIFTNTIFQIACLASQVALWQTKFPGEIALKQRPTKLEYFRG